MSHFLKKKKKKKKSLIPLHKIRLWQLFQFVGKNKSMLLTTTAKELRLSEEVVKIRVSCSRTPHDVNALRNKA